MPERVPSPFKPGRPALVEPIVQPLYSSVEYTGGAAVPSSVSFFGVTQGASSPLFTNMELAGVLANPKVFVVRGFRLHIQQNVAVTDTTMAQFVGIVQLIDSLWYSFTVGTKEYLRAPAHYLTSGLGAWLSNAAAGSEATNEVFYTGTLGVPQHENYFKINRRPIVIPPQQSFSATLTLGVASFTLSGATRRVWNYLEGDLAREVQ